MKLLTRRRVLLAGAAAVGVAATGATVAVVPLGAAERIKGLIRSRLDYLQISDEVLNAFIRDYKADPFNRFKDFGTMQYAGRKAAYGAPLVHRWLPPQRLERHIVAQFLQSTDFFRQGADVNRPVAYWRYIDPYRIPCANQFMERS